MQLGIVFSDFGLSLDLLGALLIFVYGIAPALSRDGSILLSTGESTSEKIKAEKYDLHAKLGVIFLFLGFALQILSNHIHSRQQPNKFLLWTIFLSTTACIYIAVNVIEFWRTNRILLLGQYFPQYKIGTNSYEHLWLFIIDNNKRKRVNAELQLPQQVKQVDVMQKGKQLRSTKDVERAIISDISPRGRVFIRVYNLAAIESIAADTYMIVEDKVINAKIINTLDYN